MMRCAGSGAVPRLVASRRVGRGDSVNQIGPMLVRSILAAGVSAAAASLRVLSIASIRTSEFAGGTIISPRCADGVAQLDSSGRLVESSDDNFRVLGITGTSRPVSGSAARACARRENEWLHGVAVSGNVTLPPGCLVATFSICCSKNPGEPQFKHAMLPDETHARLAGSGRPGGLARIGYGGARSCRGPHVSKSGQLGCL
jgi:hypothetical protein